MLSENKILIRILILISLLSVRCDDHDRDRYNCDSAICSEEFRSIVLTIKHSTDNTPYILSDYKVIRVSDNKDITIPCDSFLTNNGYYTVANDSQEKLFRFKNADCRYRQNRNPLPL
jgi:hypothetical protein